MGYASPSIKVGYNGYVASANTLQIDATEYSTSSTSGVVKITGIWLEDVTAGSTIRFKVDLKKAGGGAARCRIYIDGVAKGASYLFTKNVGYTGVSEDITVDWDRNAVIEIKLWSSVGGTAYMDNTEIAATRSPLLFT